MSLPNGQKVGIVLSVVWAMGAYLTVTQLDYATATKQVAVTHRLCSELNATRNDHQAADCSKEEQKTWENWTSLTLVEALAVAVIPIPFGWLFADLITWALRRKKSHLV